MEAFNHDRQDDDQVIFKLKEPLGSKVPRRVRMLSHKRALGHHPQVPDREVQSTRLQRRLLNI